MSKIKLNIEFMPGTDIQDAIQEAKEKALAWDAAYICFKFNGWHFSVSRNANVQEMYKEYALADVESHPKYIVG